MKDKVYFSSTDIRYRTGTEGTEVVEDMETETNEVEVTEADQKELEVMETDKEEVEVQNAETEAGTSDAPVKTLPAQTRSILTPRQSS